MSKENAVSEKNQSKWRFRWWLKLSAIVVSSLLVLTVGALAFLLLYPELQSYPEPPAQPAVSQLEQNLQDLEHLRQFPDFERGFTPRTDAEFKRALSAMEKRAGEMDRAELAMGAAKAVALVDNGHTNVLGLVGGHGFNAVPIRLGWFADGLFVIAAADDQAHLLGAQVLGANGKAADDLLAALRPYVGGPANLAKELAPNFLISPELLHAAGLAETAGSSRYDMRLADGSARDVELAARPGTQAPLKHTFWPARDLSPIAQADQPAGWRHVLDGVAPAAYLAQPDRNYWHSYPRPDLLYVQINRVIDQAPIALSQYLAAVLDEAAEKQVRDAVVDLRFNIGGNYMLTADFARRLPELLPSTGRLFVLTSASTFSAGISTAAWLKYYGGARVTIVGENIGDRMQFWAEGGLAILPNSKLAIQYTNGFHDWEHGCRLSQITTCFLLNYIYDVPAGSLEPDIVAQPTFADYLAGKDRVMAVVLDALDGPSD